jgi:hypothetical protein
MNRDSAETLALEALAFLIGDADLGPMFLNATGMAPADLAARAGEPTVLAGVLGFLMQDDRWIRDFCEATGRPPANVQRALHALPGGASVDWT